MSVAANPKPHADIVVAHDYLTQHGGAERVALQLAHQLDARRLVTAVYTPAQTFRPDPNLQITEIRSKLVRSFANDPRKALPFLARAWSKAAPIEAEAVVCSSSGWSHGIPTTEGTRKIVYCHNPARWLYQPDDYTRGMPRTVRAALATLSPGLRRWDRRAAHSADAYVANSTVVAQRIRDTYGIEATVVHPPVSIDVDGPQEEIPGLDAGFFLTVARPRGYKGTTVLTEAFRSVPDQQLVVVGTRLADADLPPNVRALGAVAEAELRWLYAHARSLLSVSHEDFGLTPLEANAFGTPALVLRAGGFLDSTAEGVSGMFIENDTPADVITAVRAFGDDWKRTAILAHAAEFSPAAFGRRIHAVIGGTAAQVARPIALPHIGRSAAA